MRQNDRPTYFRLSLIPAQSLFEFLRLHEIPVPSSSGSEHQVRYVCSLLLIHTNVAVGCHRANKCPDLHPLLVGSSGVSVAVPTDKLKAHEFQ